MKIFYTLLFTILASHSITALADNVILMIGDGMGKNHISCVENQNNLFLKTLTPKGEIKTHSASHKITDSAASATAYSCGEKTTNSFLGMLPSKEHCKTLAEISVEKGFTTILRTTDVVTGATPSAFYAHVDSRYKTKEIEKYLTTASKKMDIKSVKHIDTEVELILKSLQTSEKPFFVMIEESEIDKQSHHNNFNKMKEALIRFDKAIEKVVNFAKTNKNTTVIILADHETGGLTNECKYTKNNHTATNVSYYVEGKSAHMFDKLVLENTEIHHKIKEILF